MKILGSRTAIEIEKIIGHRGAWEKQKDDRMIAVGVHKATIEYVRCSLENFEII